MDRLAAMETFISVIEAGSFSGAAQRLKLGQPAVSKAVAQLERRLGVRLVLRSSRGLTATEAGRRYYEHAKRAVEEADAGELAVRDSAAGLSGRLRVCAALTFARLHVVPKLPRFFERHPQLDVEILLDDRHIDLLEAGIDVALRMGELEDSGMTARLLGRRPRLVVGTPAYFSRAGVPRHPAELREHQLILHALKGASSSWTFRRNGEEAAISVSGRLGVSAAEGVRAAVLADMGVTIASQWLFADELAAGTVQAVLEDWTLPPVDLWALYPSGRLASAKARAFVDFVEELLAGCVE